MDMKRFFLYAIVIVALALEGCGGGGGGTQTAMPDPTPPDPPAMVTCPDGSMAATMAECPEDTEGMALQAAQDAAMEAAMAAMAAVGGAVDPVARGNAYDYAKMAQDASDMAAAATTSAMAEEYQMTAEAARNKAMEAAMMRSLGITSLANKIINQSDIDNAVLEGKTGDDIPKPNSNLKARVGTALDNSAGRAAVVDTGNAGNISQGANADNSDNAAASATVDHTTAGLRFAVTRGTGDVLRGEDPTPLMTSGEKPSGGWPGAEMVRTDSPAGKTYVNVYTDINPDTQEYNSAAPNDAALTLPTTPTGAVSKVTADDGVPADGSSFTGTYNANSLDNNPPVTGQFNCPAQPCSISVDEDGVILAIQGYRFYPATGVTRPDSDYMSWGVWLTVPDVTDAGVINPAMTGAFASGNLPFNVRAALKGTATYNGDATGLYAAGGYVDYFDADVTLNANFGGTEGADSDTTGDTTNDMLLLGVVTGTVSNITAGGMAVDGSLMLGRATVTTDTAGDASADGFTGATTGTLAGRAMVGNWGGQFYGPSSATGTAAQTQYPTTAAGTFGATAPGNVNDPVRILGAFGAWKAD